MFSPRFQLLTLTLLLLLLAGCTTPKSEDWVDTIFCWLRPSCLPSQPPQPQTPTKPATSKPSTVRPKQKQTQTSLQKKSESQTHVQQISPNSDPPPCLPSTKAAGSVSGSIKRVSYTEPSTQADGKTLTDLKKTSIYFQPGNNPAKRTLIRECAATKDQGGGMIPKGGGTIQVNIREKIGPDAKICVSATDTAGNEGSSICELIIQ